MQKSRALLRTLQKIPIFQDLSPSQVQKVLGLCQTRTLKAGEVVCARGTDSNEMYILISGELAIIGEKDVRLASLQPITTVGEMGIFNRHRRSASVEVLEQSKVLVIERAPLEALLRADSAMRVRMYQNVVEILSSKIVNDNVRSRDYVAQRVRAMKEQRGLRKKLDSAVELLTEKAGLAAEEARALIDERATDERLRILIVDDEPAMRQLVTAVLVNYEVDEASDGEEALAAIRADRPDLVISDIRMPGMDGFALASRLKEEFPEVPVIALSGHVETKDVQDHNFVGFLEKPMRIEQFQQMIEGALDQGD
ncbi:MAG: response regulator [Candidatus Latescibacteria bacterium]|nr:response regulator [Candidatus Latescibacterota bacterium]